MPQTNERPLSALEVAVIRWMLEHAATEGSLLHLVPSIPQLRVVSGCDCGCPSVDFERKGQAPPYAPIADASGMSPEGKKVGVLLWGSREKVTGLEVYPDEGDEPFSLPTTESLVASFG